MTRRVCSSCFGDQDIRQWIREENGPRGCNFCKKYDSPTCSISEIARRIESCLRKYWGLAVDQLPYISAEGGYQGDTWDTYDLLVDEAAIDLPRDHNNQLLHALISDISDEVWCDYDWLSLDEDVALQTSWDRFCDTIKHERRFFFYNADESSRDSFSPRDLLISIATISDAMELIREIPKGSNLWRARVDTPARARLRAIDFGPPPPIAALQSNRMNPPGIPMLYVASSSTTAIREARATSAHVGQWITNRDLLVLDLREIPPPLGIFSSASRRERLTLRFLRHFQQDIMKPVARDNRTHIDYLPSQVVTEFLRDHQFDSRTLDGIAYKSTIAKGWNLALFANANDLGLAERSAWEQPRDPWMTFKGFSRKRAP